MDYQQGLKLIRQHKFKEALQCLLDVLNALQDSIDPNLLYTVGLCYWKLGNDTRAEEILTQVVAIDNQDIDAQRILERIHSKKIIQTPLPTPPPLTPVFQPKAVVPPPDQSPLTIDFQKDGVIIDANFLIKVHNHDPPRFPRLLKKTRRRFNLYTSPNVFFEMNPIGFGLPSYTEVQNLILGSIIQIEIPPTIISSLEEKVIHQFPEGTAIKQNHADRPHAWINDLSLICLLGAIQNPIRYIVTNDWGVQKIVHFLYPTKDKTYYLRSLTDFLISVNLLCGTNQKTVWEEILYSSQS